MGDKVKSTNAASTIFGYQFQTYVGIVLALRFIDIMNYVDVEGYKQDAEVKLKNNSIIYCQAKSSYSTDVSKSSNTHWGYQLIKGLDLLFKDFYYSESKTDNYIYAVNYYYPLGTENNCGESFGNTHFGLFNNYMDLNKDQKEVVYNHLIKKNDWTYRNFDKVHSYINQFLQQLNFVNYDFVRHHGLGKNRKYESLYNTTQIFLQRNHLYPRIEPHGLSEYWMRLFYDNSIDGPSCKVTKNELCISIYTFYVGSETQNEIGGKRLSQRVINDLVNRFKTTIIRNNYSLPFRNKLKVDMTNEFGKNYLNDIIGSDKIDKFVRTKESNYEPFFDLDISPKHRKMLTEYALTDYINKRSFMHELLHGDIKNVD